MTRFDIDSAELATYAGLVLLCIGVAFAHIALAFLVAGLGLMFLGLMAARSPE